MKGAVFALLAVLIGCDCSQTTQQTHPLPASPKTGGIQGVVTFTGTLPKRDPPIAGLPPGMRVDRSRAQSLLVGANGGLANVFVAIETGVKGSYPTPNVPARLDQIGFLYEPRVLGIMKDQALIVRNGDRFMHNLHIRPGRSPIVNVGQPSKDDEDTFKFSEPELGIRIKCDVHPWMVGWLHVSDHPFFTVTGTDGRFTINNVPPGEYGIIAWHERFMGEPLRAKVKVEAGRTTPLDFTFKRIQK